MKTSKNEKINPRIVKFESDNDLTDHYWSSINYFVGLIKSTELKAGLILSFYGFLLNFVYQSLVSNITLINGNYFLYSLLGLWFMSCLISIYYSIKTFIPHIEGKYDTNAFFFSDVVTKYGDIKKFSQMFCDLSLNDEELFDQLGQQVFINAKIASIKFKTVNLSFRFMAIGLALLLLILLYSFIIVVL